MANRSWEVMHRWPKVVWCTCAAANDSSLIRRSDVSVGLPGSNCSFLFFFLGDVFLPTSLSIPCSCFTHHLDPRYDGKLESHPHHHRHHRAHRKPSPRVQLKMDQVKEIPHCDQEYSCDAQRTKHLGDFARKRIAATLARISVLFCSVPAEERSPGARKYAKGKGYGHQLLVELVWNCSTCFGVVSSCCCWISAILCILRSCGLAACLT